MKVSRLIYTSTIDVVVGYDDIYDGDETLPVPNKLLFPGYPDTKYRAEQLILAANGRPLVEGKRQMWHSRQNTVQYDVMPHICLRHNCPHGRYLLWKVILQEDGRAQEIGLPVMKTRFIL